MSECASGFHSDGNGNCVATSPIPTPSCQSGYKYDGDGVCVTIDVPILCVNGYTSDGAGGCVPVTVAPKSLCPSGYYSDGEGNCLPNTPSEVTCADGFTLSNGVCIWIPS